MKALLEALATAGGFRLQENVSYGGVTVDPDESLYRRLTGSTGGRPGFPPGSRDIPPDQYLRVQQAAVRSFILNPFARRMAQLPKDFMIAEGVRPTGHPDIQDWLDTFWDDPVNKMNDQVEILALEYELLGEVILPLFVNDGMTRLTLADPLLVSQTHPDPGNVRTIIGVEFRASVGTFVLPTILGVGIDETKVLSPEAVATRNVWRAALPAVLQGEGILGVLYFGANRIAGTTRGLADLAASLDHLDILDRNLFDMLERAGLMNAFVWDVVLQNADDTKIKQWVKDHPAPPRPGSVNVHNQSETWTPSTPDLKHADLSVGFKTGKHYVIGNLGYAPAWLGESEMTRASAQEQGDPALKTVTAHQRRLRNLLETLLQVVVWQGVEAGKLKGTVTGAKGKTVPAWSTVGVAMPDLSPKDVARAATAFGQAATAAVSAVTGGVLSAPTATRVLTAILPHLGVEVDADEEIAAIADQAIEDAAAFRDRAGVPAGRPRGTPPAVEGNPEDVPPDDGGAAR